MQSIIDGMTTAELLFYFMWACILGGSLIAGAVEWLWVKIVAEVDYLTQDGGIW